MAGVLLKDLFKSTSGRIDFRIRRLRLALATKESASTALLYGAAVQSITYLLNWVRVNFNRVQTDDHALEIFADFGSEKTSVDIDVSASMHLSSAISVALKILRSYRAELKIAKRNARLRALEKNAASTDNAS